MSDWQVGDLAVCVDASTLEAYLAEGTNYTVVAVWYGIPDADVNKPAGACLDLAGVPRWGDNIAYAVERFRKIRPDEHEACEPEFVTLLRRSKVTVHPDPMRRVA